MNEYLYGQNMLQLLKEYYLEYNEKNDIFKYNDQILMVNPKLKTKIS